MFKKFLSVLLTIAMLLSMIPAVFAAEAEPQGVTAGDNTVTIRIIGSSVPETKPSLNSTKYDYGGAQYQNWLKTTTYKVADDTTVQQLLDQALTDAGFTYEMPSDYLNKLKIFAPAEYGGHELGNSTYFSTGKWMITCNQNGAYKSEDTSKMDDVVSDGYEVILRYAWSTNYEKHGKAWESFTWAVPDVSPAEYTGALKTMELINAIGRVDPESGAAITAARQAYDALSEAARTLVTNYDLLTAAEATFKDVEDYAATRTPLPAPTISAGTNGFYTYVPTAVIEGVEPEKYTMMYRISLDGENWGAWQYAIEKLLPMESYYVQGKALTNDWKLYDNSEGVSNVIRITTAGEDSKVVTEVTDKDTLMAALQAVQADGKLYIIDFKTDVLIDDIIGETYRYDLPAGSNVLLTSSNGSKYYFNETGNYSFIGVTDGTTVTIQDLYIGMIAGSSQLTPGNEQHKVLAFTDANTGVVNLKNVTMFTNGGGKLVGYNNYNKLSWAGTVNVYSGVLTSTLTTGHFMDLAAGSELNLIPTGDIMLEGGLGGKISSVNILDLLGVTVRTAVETQDQTVYTLVDTATMTTVMKYSTGLRLNVTEGNNVPPVVPGEIVILPADDSNAANADVTYVIHDNDISFTYKDRANAVYQIKFHKWGNSSDWFYTRGGEHGKPVEGDALNQTRTYTGLTQDTEYSFTIRYSSLDSNTTAVEKEIVLKTTYTPVALNVPTLSDECEKTDSTITVTAPAASSQDTTAVVQYRIRKAGSETWGAWQESLTFTGLEGYTNYEIQAMYKAVHYLWLDSAESNTITIKTKAPVLQAPPAVKAEDVTAEFDAITVPVPAASSQDPDAAVMYRIGTLKDSVGLLQTRSVTEDQITWGEWQESNVFTGLEADTTYYVQSQYVTEKAEWNNSVLSEIVEIKTATNESAPHFKVESAAGKAGSEVKVVISVKNNPGIITAYLNIGYDATKLQLMGYEDLKLLPDGSFSALDANPFKAQWDGALLPGNLTANGDILVLTFKILEGCQIGDVTDVTVTYNPNEIYDFNMQNVKFAVVNGTVTVTSHIWGEATYTWNADHTECTATHSCTCCETAVSESETVSAAIDTVPPTETEKGSSTYTANFTKTGFTTQTYVKILPATGTLIEIGTAEGCIGEEIKVNVTFAQNPGIAGAELILGYDTDKLEFVGFENGEILSNMMTNDKYNGNQLYISWVNDANAEGDGVVLTLTFKIKDSCAVGDTAVVSIVSFKAHDYDTTDVEFNPMDGNVSVVDHSWGEWVYTWNADHTACTAKREQDCGCGAVQSQTVRSVIVSKDCETIVYLAHFTNGAADATETVAINAHKHIVSGSEDGKTITYTCTACGDTYDVIVAESAEASKLPVLTVSNVQGFVGQTVEIPVVLSNNPGLKAMEFTVTYNAAALKLVDVKDGGLFGSFAWNAGAARTGSAIITLGGENEIADTTTNGTAVTLVFEIVDASENANVSVSYMSGDVYSGDTGAMDVVIDNGSVAIKTFMLGDVNKDGVVDIKDVTILRRYLAGTVAADTVDAPAADCNEDGVVDIKDVTILRRYLAGTAELGK